MTSSSVGRQRDCHGEDTAPHPVDVVKGAYDMIRGMCGDLHSAFARPPREPSVRRALYEGCLRQTELLSLDDMQSDFRERLLLDYPDTPFLVGKIDNYRSLMQQAIGCMDALAGQD